MRFTYKSDKDVANIGAAKTGSSTTEIPASPTTVSSPFSSTSPPLSPSKTDADVWPTPSKFVLTPGSVAV